ncbi:phage tail-collar fiber domain-containing protein [Pseudomonas sp. AIG]
MIDANSQFFAILTNVGMAKQANADALGIPWLITQMGVGDANGTEPIPSASQTKLINEWRRKPLNQLKIDPINPAVIIAEQIIPADEGGKWIREIGLYDADGDLVAVANCAPSFKPLLSQGSGRTQIVRMNFIVTSTGNIQLKIDPAIVLASRAYVDAAILEVLPKNKVPGEYTRVKVNDRGIVVSGDNPETLAAMGIKDSYTKAEIEAMIAQASALPVGAMVAFPLDKVAPGFLELDGSVKSIAVYPDLAAFLGTAFNKGGEGTGNFRLPESRAEFLRGWDHGRGVDAGRAIGSNQLGSNVRGVASNSGTPSPGNIWNNTEFDELGNQSFYVTQSTTTQFSVQTGVVRPRNLAVMWCIKAWNAPINQGNIDIAALAALATQATEIKLGTAKIATQAQFDAGTDDTTIVTPKKLRQGFMASLSPNGYQKLPSGLIEQWGTVSVQDNTEQTVLLSTAFPNAILGALASVPNAGSAGPGEFSTAGVRKNGSSLNSILVNSNSGPTVSVMPVVFWRVWGY